MNQWRNLGQKNSSEHQNPFSYSALFLPDPQSKSFLLLVFSINQNSSDSDEILSNSSRRMNHFHEMINLVYFAEFQQNYDEKVDFC